MNEEVIYPSMVIRSQAEAIDLLEKENKQLKEQLLVAKTNEETFRLEMEDITQTLGLDEDTIFDDVKTYARSLKENKILRENAEHNDKVVDKVNWENMLLKKENQDLKKQLEEYQLQNIDLRADIMIQKKALPNKEIKDKTFYNLLDMPTYEDLLEQQKEFISYLENEINKIKEQIKNYDIWHEVGTDINFLILKKQFNIEILSKYKEIIGE